MTSQTINYQRPSNQAIQLPLNITYLINDNQIQFMTNKQHYNEFPVSSNYIELLKNYLYILYYKIRIFGG